MEDIEYKRLQKSSYLSAALTLMGFVIIVGSLAFSYFQIKEKEIRVNELTEKEKKLASKITSQERRLEATTQELEKKRQELTSLEGRIEDVMPDFERVFVLLDELHEDASGGQIAGINEITKVSGGIKIILEENLLISLVKQLDKTKAAFERYVHSKEPWALRALWEGNNAALSLLKARKHLLPDDLRKDADQLIVHYDVWLREYASVVNDKELTTETPFVFAGPKGTPFPVKAEQHLRKRLESILR